ncbi:hypothetical protein HOLleu_15912 [Holothuria leucospilota]|uniref:arylamine N-acetyltransferase n=1 Tax=Holothuria leucospilota TaxID=206669 RepID=A0A9Q1HA95_HOLLE|nr:hypothetical protein HOLleu_15912 [Holothuria leucospilota]
MEAIRGLPQIVRSTVLSSRLAVPRKHYVPSYKMIRRFGDEAVSTSMSSQASPSAFPLTTEEAFTFLERYLDIPKLQLFTEGKSLHFLNRVIKEMDRRIPFTTINYLTERPLSNLKPEDWKDHILSGQGGTCRWINPFTKAFLERLGYTTLQIPGNYPVTDGKRQTHISTLVCNVSHPGSRHLVDPGTRLPPGEAVPLDFETESPEYTPYKERCKFFKHGNDFIRLCIPDSSGGSNAYIMNDSRGAKWETRIEYWLNEQTTWTHFNECFFEVYEKLNVPLPKPYDALVFYGFVNEKKISIVCSDGQIHATFYNTEDRTMEQVMMTKTEMLDFFQNYYPQFSITKLEKACEISKLT